MSSNTNTKAPAAVSAKDLERLIAEAQAEPGIADMMTMLEQWHAIESVARDSQQPTIVVRDATGTARNS
jgi:hypothetical protein